MSNRTNKMTKETAKKQKQQFAIRGVVKRYLVKCTDAEGEREAVFNARTTKQAYKQARRKLWVRGDAEYSFTELSE